MSIGGTVFGMNPRAAITTAAGVVVGASVAIDDAATDLERIRGRVTMAGRALMFGSALLAVGAIPLIVLESLIPAPRTAATN